MKQHALRISDELMAAIDKRAAKVELSRNAWLTKAIEWALDQPVTTRTTTKRV